MSENTTRRTVLKGSLAAAAVLVAPTVMAKEITITDLQAGLAKPLSPENEKLAAAALKDVQQTSVNRRRHKLTENSEPSLIFQVRAGATTTW